VEVQCIGAEERINDVFGNYSETSIKINLPQSGASAVPAKINNKDTSPHFTSFKMRG
jgi:hypothetical protein